MNKSVEKNYMNKRNSYCNTIPDYYECIQISAYEALKNATFISWMVIYY